MSGREGWAELGGKRAEPGTQAVCADAVAAAVADDVGDVGGAGAGAADIDVVVDIDSGGVAGTVAGTVESVPYCGMPLESLAAH